MSGASANNASPTLLNGAQAAVETTSVGSGLAATGGTADVRIVAEVADVGDVPAPTGAVLASSSDVDSASPSVAGPLAGHATGGVSLLAAFSSPVPAASGSEVPVLSAGGGAAEEGTDFFVHARYQGHRAANSDAEWPTLMDGLAGTSVDPLQGADPLLMNDLRVEDATLLGEETAHDDILSLALDYPPEEMLQLDRPVPLIDGEVAGQPLPVVQQQSAGEPLLTAEPQPAAAAAAARAQDEVVCICTDFFPETDDPDVNKDRWMTVRTFIAAMLAEPVLNVFGGCDLINVEVLARALINAVPSAAWIKLAPAVTPVVFVWQFLLLVRNAMDESPSLCQAIGELIFFCVAAEEETMPRWEAKAGRAAKEYRNMWEEGDADKHKAWLLTRGVEPAVSHVVAGDHSKARVQEQASKARTGQAWAGRHTLRAFPEDSTAERERAKAAEKRKAEPAKTKEPKKAWDADDCRHDYPVSVLRAPGVMTFMCGCGYIIGFELLRETESPAHVVAALIQRFKRLPRVIYFDTACQAQRNALRRVPWMMDGVCTAWFIDRFHRCNHQCSPVFNADQVPHLTRGHDTSGAERQHSIKKRSKNSLSYMTQRRFITRSRFISAHNNIHVSQRRQATAMAAATRAKGDPKLAVEIQHKPVEAYFHHYIVSHCELGDECPCRMEVMRVGPAGLERKS